MGKITVLGVAKREVDYDQVRINIIFSEVDKLASRATEEVLKKSNVFIESLVRKGIEKEFIHFKEDELLRNSRYDEDNSFTAERSIYIDLEFNMSVINLILKLIKGYDGEICYHMDFFVSNLVKIHEELIVEAFKDSQEKAECIVESYGRKIEGVKSINTMRERISCKFLNCFKLNDTPFEDEINEISNLLSAPTTLEEEQIEVVWLF